MDRRVVITGIGVISCTGNSVPQYWESLVNGECGISKVSKFDASEYRTQIGGEVKNFDPKAYLPPKEVKKIDPFCQYAIAASDEAMETAGIPKDLSGLDPDKVGVLVSSGIGGIQTIEKQHQLLMKKGPSKVSPFLVPMMIIDLASGNISMRYGAKGPNMGVVTACATSTHSLGESYWMIKRGDADVMISGGAEAGISPISFAGFCAMKAMSQRNDDPEHASRPFDYYRDGFVMSEGSAVLILEELEHAKARGANILAEFAGYGATGDAYHMTAPAPEGEGAAKSMKVALNHAGMNANEIEYINAHGTSTPHNDKFETQAYKSVFKEHAYNIPISSIKGSVGHNLGAAGSIELISCIKTLQTGIIPPTINYQTPDPECDLDYTPNEAREKKEVGSALTMNLGFGGHNAAIVLKKYK